MESERGAESRRLAHVAIRGKSTMKNRKRNIVGRIGPALNLRPAGSHRDQRRKPRSHEKAQLARMLKREAF